jgi:hypothetical protein
LRSFSTRKFNPQTNFGSNRFIVFVKLIVQFVSAGKPISTYQPNLHASSMKKTKKKTRTNSKKTSRRRRSRTSSGTSFEQLEVRNLLAAVTVSTAADVVDGDTSSISVLVAAPGSDGSISLREAITAAENTPGLDTINFDAATFNGEFADVIRLQSRLIVLDSTEIDGANFGVVVSGDTLGDDTLRAGSFVTDAQATAAAGSFADNTNGVFVFAGGDSQEVTISGLTITGGDSTTRGGGLQVANFAQLSVSKTTVAGNRAAVSGGGIQSDSGSLTIDQSSIGDNLANTPDSFINASGGGIAAVNSDVVITSSTISGNVSFGEISEGGGVHVDDSSFALTNSTVSGNFAGSPFSNTTAGGGLFLNSQSVSIVNSTITENTAEFGGGVANNSSSFGAPATVLNNSIIAGNTAAVSGPDLLSSFSSTYDASFNLIGDNSASGLPSNAIGIPDALGNLIGTTDAVIEPRLGALGDNGGPTLTHDLLPESPANNIGNSTIAFDQRGIARVIGNGSDIGAVEQASSFIVVDNSGDTNDGDFSQGNLTLREAIGLSAQTAEDKTIMFDPAVFNGEQADVIYLEAALPISETTTIDAGDLDVVISGDRSSNDALLTGTFITDVQQNSNTSDNVQVFDIFVTSSDVVTLKGLTITGGFESSRDGGGISSNDGALIVEDSIVVGNFAEDAGGGIYVDQGSVTIIDSFVSRNRSNTRFSFGGGGGVATDSADVTIINSSFGDNSAGSNGGGIHSVVGRITITNSTISENESGGGGGGIHSREGQITVTNSTISGNNSEQFGGGISADFGSVTVIGSTINGNEGLSGGGGIDADAGVLEVSNSTISQNTAQQGGSGVQTSTGIVIITDSTVTLNRINSTFGTSGAGISIGNEFDFSSNPSLTLSNSIVAGNTQGANTNFDLRFLSNAVISMESSLLGSNAGNSITSAPIGSPDANGNLIGTGFTPIDPMLDVLADNGGPTQTHALLPGSPAIDAGNSLSTIDQRGRTRPLDQPNTPNPIGGNGSDIGAFEFQKLLLTVDSSVDSFDGDFSTGNLSLREAITLANDNPGADSITFSADVFNGEVEDVIRLQFGELQITEAVTIDAGDLQVVISSDALGNDIVDPITFVTDAAASDVSNRLGDNNNRVFNITTTVGEDVTLEGLTITGGVTAADGGGIFVSGTTLNLNDATVSGNVTSKKGGGVFSDQDVTFTSSTLSGNIADGGGGIATTSGSVTLDNSTVSANLATGAGGGGISTFSGDVLLNTSDVTENSTTGAVGGGGIFTTSGAVTIDQSNVSGNQSSFEGGGISAAAGDVTITDSTINDNDARLAGGGIWIGSGALSISNSVLNANATPDILNLGTLVGVGGGGIFAATGSVSIDQSTLSGNTTTDDHFGGGAIRTDSANISITSSTISGNSTSGDEAQGGAVATNSGNVVIDTSTFHGNVTLGEGSNGGAVVTNSGSITTTSSTFSGNRAVGFDANGGAIASKSGAVTFTSSTITGNSTNLDFNFGGFGGGVFIATPTASAPLTILSSIVAGNDALFGDDLRINTSSTAIQSSLIGNKAGTFLIATTANTTDADGNLIGSATATVDPMLDVLSDNGGPTLTHALLAGSPAIDLGSSSLSNDQRGVAFTRTFGEAPDIGAYEFQVLNLLVDTDSDIVDGDFSARQLSLREAIDLANINPGEDLIRFSPSQFRGFSFDAIHLTQGPLTITESVDIDGEALRVVVSGDRDRDDRNFSGTAITDLSANTDARLDDNSGVFNITAAAGDVVSLGGLIITGGISQSGGGISNESADVVVQNSTIAGNRVLGNGGAIYNDSGSLTISNSTISGNETDGIDSSGGGIHTGTGALSLTNSTISGNRSTGINGDGGGISTSSGDITLNSVTITNNSAANAGGGIFVDGSAADPLLSINNTIIAANNSVTSADVQFDSSGAIDINFSLIGDNSGTSLVAAAVGSPDANGNLIGSSGAVIDPLLESLADVGGLTLTHQPLVSSPVINAGGSSALTNDQRNITLLTRNDGNGVDIGAFEFYGGPFVVDSIADVVDGDYTSGNFSLREAVELSNVNPSPDIITFDPNVFDQQPSDVIRLQAGTLVVSAGVVIDAADAGVVISGDASGNDVLIPGSFITDTFTSETNVTLADNVRVFDITAAADEMVSFIGITITGGVTPDTFEDGGGLRSNNADLAFTNVTIAGNRTDSFGDGGGIAADQGTVSFDNSIVSANFSGSDGGGIYLRRADAAINNSTFIDNFSESNGGGIFSTGNVFTVNDSLISDNTIGGFANGGGIYTSSGDATLNNTVVTENITGEFGNGGGIYLAFGNLTLNRSSVSNNNAGSDGDGGGIYAGSGDVTSTDSTLSDNTAGDNGGGIFISSADLLVDRSTISGNQSGEDGGGINSRFGDIVLQNSTLSGNSSGLLGGGIFQDFGDVTNIINSTVVNNQSQGNGGGIYHAGSSSSDVMNVENSIVANNTNVNGIAADLFYNAVAISLNHSLIGSNNNTPLQATNGTTPDANGNLIGGSGSPLDPLLGPLADNGGQTLTHALLAGSPAINAGGSVAIETGDTDQRGEDRISDGQVDIGAFETESTLLLGDVNRDSVVSFLDIFPFIEILSGNGFQDEADINRDGAVTFIDIAPFIELLSSQQTATSPQPVTASSPAQQLEARPEIFDELEDFELDELIEGLPI